MTKPMTLVEFADYAKSIPQDQQKRFDSMLAFVENTVREDCARIVDGWHIKRGGYGELAHEIRDGKVAE